MPFLMAEVMMEFSQYSEKLIQMMQSVQLRTQEGFVFHLDKYHISSIKRTDPK